MCVRARVRVCTCTCECFRRRKLLPALSPSLLPSTPPLTPSPKSGRSALLPPSSPASPCLPPLIPLSALRARWRAHAHASTARARAQVLAGTRAGTCVRVRARGCVCGLRELARVWVSACVCGRVSAYVGGWVSACVCVCGRVGAMGGCIDGPQWCIWHFARSLIQREPARSHERVLGCVARAAQPPASRGALLARMTNAGRATIMGLLRVLVRDGPFAKRTMYCRAAIQEGDQQLE